MDMYTGRGITLQKVEKQKTPNVGVTAMEQMLSGGCFKT